MGKSLKSAKACKQPHSGARYVVIELHRWNRLLDRLEGLIAAGSADARSLAADVAAPIKAKARQK